MRSLAERQLAKGPRWNACALEAALVAGAYSLCGACASDQAFTAEFGLVLRNSGAALKTEFRTLCARRAWAVKRPVRNHLQHLRRRPPNDAVELEWIWS